MTTFETKLLIALDELIYEQRRANDIAEKTQQYLQQQMSEPFTSPQRTYPYAGTQW